MTKKASIFKILVEYFRAHTGAVLGWIWVSFVPLLGSLILASQYTWLEKVSLESLSDHLALIFSLSIVLGLALLPTTLTALACGFFWGWVGFPDLLFGYILANAVGYSLGKRLNSDFSKILFARNPDLKKQIESKIDRPAGLIFFIRISPVIPFAISNFLFASMGIPLRKVLLYGVPGMLPRTFMAFASGMIANSFLGARESMKDPMHWAILIFLLILSFGGIYLSWKKGKA
jgi:uncharacterized membrane protein YdjX (TVP38/TMEM64 family)